MQKRTRVLSIVLVAVLLSPAAAASWSALGTVEPDTTHDIDDGYMFTEPNDLAINKVYFNVVPTQTATSTNPNMATLGESRALSPYYTFEAFYGVWVDCNGDDYIGMADTALFEYRAELLSADSPCNPPNSANLHNQQGWVSEMRWIGRHGGADSQDADDLPDGRDNRIISDYESDIWGDRGIPGAAVTPPKEVCSRGYHSTGQLLNAADCNLRTAVVPVDSEAATGLLAGTPLAFQPDGDGQINYDQSHPLNAGTFGNEGSGQDMVGAWDCSTEVKVSGLDPDQGVSHQEAVMGYKTPGVQVTDSDGELNVSVYSTTNTNGTDYRDDLTLFGVRLGAEPSAFMPKVPSLNSGGSVAGTWNATTDGATGDCDPTTSGKRVRGYDTSSLYAAEVAEDARTPAKFTVDMTFEFFEEQRSGAGKRGEPFDRGVYPVVRQAWPISGSLWYMQGSYTWNDGGAPNVVRADLKPAEPTYFTFYANMSANAITEHSLILPKGTATGIYGDEWCQGLTTGVVRGFNCDPDEWYVEADGVRKESNQFQVFAGHTYYLRDIDCYDYHVTSELYASGAATSAQSKCSVPAP